MLNIPVRLACTRLVAGAAAVSLASVVAAAPADAAEPLQSCTSLGFTPTSSACTVAAGETVSYWVLSGSGGNGGAGGDSTAPGGGLGARGGTGGTGAKIAGSYTNATDDTVTLDLAVGANGVNGANGIADTNGSDGSVGASGTNSVIVVRGAALLVVAAAGTGGQGGQGGSANGSDGAAGISGIDGEDLSILPPGGSFVTTYWRESPFVSFTGGPVAAEESEDGAVWWQSVGRAADAACPTGWAASWAQWAQPKSGGWVCDRAVFWRDGRWVQSSSPQDVDDLTDWDGR